MSQLQVRPLDDTLDNVCSTIGVEPEKLKQLQGQKAMPEPKVREYLVSVRPRMQELFEVFDTHMKSMELASVGIAIAHANMKRKLGVDADLSVWI